MSDSTYPYSRINFKAHTVATHALIVLVIIIAIAMSYVLTRATSPLPEHLPMVLGFSAVGLVWIFAASTFDAKKTAGYIYQRERFEQTLLNLLKVIDSNDSIPMEQKRLIFEWYINEMNTLDWSVASKHLSHVHFKNGGSMCQILDILNREAAAKVLKKIEENGGIIPNQQVEMLNGQSVNYTKIRMAIQP